MPEFSSCRARNGLRLGACLSLTGRFARFGTQALHGLTIWRSRTEAAELVVEDDRSDPKSLDSAFPDLARRCDLILGPYSTHLMRRAGNIGAHLDRLIWNHGGSGDDVQRAHPGHLVSVLTPASRYADPFVQHVASELVIVQGKGGFGRQVADGAVTLAHELGKEVVRLGPDDDLQRPGPWSLLCAGTFEEDVQTVRRARALPNPPRSTCAVAAGVRAFGSAVEDAQGTYGVGQWFPGAGGAPELFMTESDFLTAYQKHAGAPPDYPAVQAAATAAIATHCAERAGSTAREALWPVAAALETTTLFGAFKIDPHTGVQVGHQTAFARWAADGPVALRRL